MVQFKILTGKRAGAVIAARHFPWRIGRGIGTDCRLEDNGVWDVHLVLGLDSENGFLLSVQLDAMAVINGQPFQQQILRIGDVIELGSVKIEFLLGESRLRNSLPGELGFWLLIALVSAAQLGAVLCLLG